MRGAQFIFLGGILIVTLACRKEKPIPAGHGLEDWTTETHSSMATPDYATVFPDNKVNRIDIEIGEDYWSALQNNLDEILNAGPGFPDENPIYVPCQVYFDGKQWYDVGFRFKGNSSLSTTYNQGKSKYPIRLEFDHFDNENPLIAGQTFYGFSQLSLANNFKDISLMREKIADDLLREFGVPAAKSAFYRVYVDHGDGPVYFGLYTMVEIIFDKFLKEEFGDGSGNCYKAEGDHQEGMAGGASWDMMQFMNDYPNDFEIKSEGFTDLSDLVDMFNALTDPSRNSDPATWRVNLETVFNVDGFLKWLAANTVMENWDTYGRAPHNYYLYHNPVDGKIHWIPWDHNEMFINPTSLVPSANDPVAFDFSDVGPNWNLIKFFYGDPVYHAAYDSYIDEFIYGVFEPSKMAQQYTETYNLIQPYVTGSDGEILPEYSFLSNPAEFDLALNELINHASTRFTEADDYTP